MQHIASKYNFSDILTKHWSYQGTYHELIQPVFHHAGNTASLFLDDTLELDTAIKKGMIFESRGVTNVHTSHTMKYASVDRQ